MSRPTIFLTGCAGFIGSNFVKKIAAHETDYQFIIIDALTYAGRKQTIQPELDKYSHLSFAQINICDKESVSQIFNDKKPVGVLHFAAESHVDRSITNPNIFVETNVLGTLNLLNSSIKTMDVQSDFRFLHVSTDEVYGSLTEDEPPFSEQTSLKPNSPYSASKAGSDLLVRSYVETFKLNAVITRCTNNYGAFQFPEKLIPLMILNATQGKKLPVYGNGKNIRDWIYVDDHNRGIWQAFKKGRSGEVYNFGGNSEKRNIEVVKTILKSLNKPESLIEFVEDRKGHDWRYAIDYTKSTRELSWQPTVTFEDGIQKTVEWYSNNAQWLEMIKKVN